MGPITMRKLYFRAILILIFSSLIGIDYFYQKDLLISLVTYTFFNFISVYHIFWAFLFIEMLIVFIPKLNQFSYSGKHLKKHFKPAPNFSWDKLKEYTRQNGIKAINSAVFWILFNTPFAILFFTGYINHLFFYWLFFLYYFFDTVCINIFCIFQLFIVRNKCCNECRIYNWGHFMYTTPLLFIPNFWTYSLVFISVLILIQWELSVLKHPERFSSISNQTLQCQHCTHDCRYNSKKANLIQSLNKIGQEIYKKLEKNRNL